MQLTLIRLDRINLPTNASAGHNKTEFLYHSYSFLIRNLVRGKDHMFLEYGILHEVAEINFRERQGPKSILKAIRVCERQLAFQRFSRQYSKTA